MEKAFLRMASLCLMSVLALDSADATALLFCDVKPSATLNARGNVLPLEALSLPGLQFDPLDQNELKIQENQQAVSWLIGKPLKPPHTYHEMLFKELRRLKVSMADLEDEEIDPELMAATRTFIGLPYSADSRELFNAWMEASHQEEFEGPLEKFLRLLFREILKSGAYDELIPINIDIINELARQESSEALHQSILDASAHALTDLLSRHRREIAARGALEPLRIAFVTAEALPYSQAGGVAPVVTALAKALNQLNAWSTIFTLRYQSAYMKPSVMKPVMLTDKEPWSFAYLDPETGKTHIGVAYEGGIAAAWANDPQTWLLADTTLGAECLTAIPYARGQSDQIRLKQTTFLAQGTAELMKFLIRRGSKRAGITKPDIVIGQDAAGSMISPYWRIHYAKDPILKEIATGIDGHNLLPSYQGNFDISLFPLTSLAPEHLHGYTYESVRVVNGNLVLDGHRNYMSLVSAALFHSDVRLTVSPQYAAMLLSEEEHPQHSPERVHHLPNLLSLLPITGIAHGYEYDPRHKLVQTPEERERFFLHKAAAKLLLLQETGLWAAIERAVGRRFSGQNNSDENYRQALKLEFQKPAFGLLARLDVHQKGLHLLMDAAYGAEKMIRAGARLIVHGAEMPGEESKKFVDYMTGLAARYPEQVAIRPVFREFVKNKERARLIFVCNAIDTLEDLLYSGADVFLIPSRAEPLGWSVLQALAGGTVVLATAQGGPASQVRDVRLHPNLPDIGNGILFGRVYGDDPESVALRKVAEPYTPQGFWRTFEALMSYYARPELWRETALAATNYRRTWKQAAIEHFVHIAKSIGRYDLLEHVERRQPLPMEKLDVAA